MCGVFGAVHRTGYFDRQDYDQFLACLQRADHRGPDGWGAAALDGKAGRTGTSDQFDIFFGHRRLAVIDLRECANQPMSGAGGALWVTFNGEIYNYVELRDALRRDHGAEFRTAGDTEVILAQYEHH